MFLFLTFLTVTPFLQSDQYANPVYLQLGLCLPSDLQDDTHFIEATNAGYLSLLASVYYFRLGK